MDQKPTVTATIVDHGFFGMKTMVVCTTEEHEHEDLISSRLFQPAGSFRRGFSCVDLLTHHSHPERQLIGRGSRRADNRARPAFPERFGWRD